MHTHTFTHCVHPPVCVSGAALSRALPLLLHARHHTSGAHTCSCTCNLRNTSQRRVCTHACKSLCLELRYARHERASTVTPFARIPRHTMFYASWQPFTRIPRHHVLCKQAATASHAFCPVSCWRSTSGPLHLCANHSPLFCACAAAWLMLGRPLSPF